MRKRTKAREYALTILYQSEMTRKEVERQAEQFWSEEESKDDDVMQFCQRLISGVEINKEAINEKIAKYATNWQMKRMAVIDRNILRLGVFELVFALDIPPKVTINEAVELAKKYGDLESSKFVNGILDKIHKTELNTPKES
jgi:N utilization substance protein B